MLGDFAGRSQDGGDVWSAAIEHHFALIAARNLVRALELPPATSVAIDETLRAELPAIRKYLDQVFPQRPGVAGSMRRDFAFRALHDEVSDETTHNARDGNDRPVLVSIHGGVIRLTIFDEVGDDENKLDEMESVWLADLVGATLRRRRLADRGRPAT